MGAPRAASALATAVLALFVWHQAAFAMRYVPIEVYLDGKYVLMTSFGDRGDTSPEGIWRKLGGFALRVPEPGRAPWSRRAGAPPEPPFVIEPDAGNPNRATLRGRIVLYCPYAGEVTLSEIHLVHTNSDAKGWHVAPDDVDIILKNYKYTPPNPRPRKP